ncbi:helix-turn-helix domain-containing protein [Streptomyces sp. ME18-1-4]|uniref:helix-turn-helix domain-containing protein n=1 Tax=Streptomyces sp. ME18-1-4 TaxID=3028685 RepID=UPI0029B93F5E|nr:helix-turn-helix domain-containing protein [Streptomyces sp. ME18-1-4]MDX3248824.1 helix-turn-helix domain-containing protein [Streptomyces sp. ME18-1-4]
MSGKPTTGEARIRLRERAARLYLEGCTIASTARQIGRSYGCTRTLLIEAGVRFRKRGGAHNFRKKAA